MTEPIDYINVATTATVGASVIIVLRPSTTGGKALTVALFVLAAIALVSSVTTEDDDA